MFFHIPAVVAASQVDVSISQRVTIDISGGVVDISSCPITFYGRSFSWVDVSKTKASYCCYLTDLPLPTTTFSYYTVTLVT